MKRIDTRSFEPGISFFDFIQESGNRAIRMSAVVGIL